MGRSIGVQVVGQRVVALIGVGGDFNVILPAAILGKDVLPLLAKVAFDFEHKPANPAARVTALEADELVGVGAHPAGCLSRSDCSHVYLAGVKTALRGLQPRWIEAAGELGLMLLLPKDEK